MSLEVVGMMPFVILAGFLPGKCSSLPFLFFTTLAQVLWLRGDCSGVAMAELLDRYSNPLARVDRLQLLVPRFGGGFVVWSSPVLLIPDLQLRPPLLQVLARGGRWVDHQHANRSGTVKPISHLHRGDSMAASRTHRLVPMWMEVYAQEVSKMVLNRPSSRLLRSSCGGELFIFFAGVILLLRT
uniref:Uncharacterized protein n=1 Tax=Arundo donax TaxID=35708 RepID=A0A0A9CTS0_ARUDO